MRAFPRTTDAAARVAVQLCRVEDLEVRDALTVEIRELVEAIALEVHEQATLPRERIAALLGSIFGVRS